MTTYVFDQIDPSTPLQIEGNDQVLFHGGPARLAIATYGSVNGASIVTINFLGRSVSFDSGIEVASANHNLIFDDGSLLVMGGPRSELFEGCPGDDALFGGDGPDTLNGHEGANFIQGNQGDDRLFAGAGADTLLGGQGGDVIQSTAVVGAGEAGDFVNGNLGDDTISGGDGADSLLGGQGNDVVFGEAGADVLDGNRGDDRVAGDGAATLLGEDGNDTLTARGEGATLVGGAGGDLFVFVGAGDPAHGVRGAITDFAPEDTISFNGVMASHAYAEITAGDYAGALAEATRITTTSTDPARAGGEVVVAQVGQDLYAFAASFNSQGPSTAILIAGRTLADIGPGDFA